MSSKSKIVLLFVLLSVFVLASAVTLGAQSAASKNQASSVSSTALAQQVLVPAGQFFMGCADDLSDITCDSDAAPIHVVYLDAFFIDRMEVTNAQYAACVAKGACQEPLSYESATRSDYYTNPAYKFSCDCIRWRCSFFILERIYINRPPSDKIYNSI